MKPAARTLLAGVLVVVAGPLPAQPVVDVTRGEVDGVAALSFWPTEGFDGEVPREPVGFSAVPLPEPDLAPVYQLKVVGLSGRPGRRSSS